MMLRIGVLLIGFLLVCTPMRLIEANAVDDNEKPWESLRDDRIDPCSNVYDVSELMVVEAKRIRTSHRQG